MKHNNHVLYISFIIFFLTACSAALNDYDDVSQPFDIIGFFSGDIVGWGMVQDYNQKVTRRFCVEIKGTWQNNKGVLAETFYFKDGEVTYRNWQLKKDNNGHYTGTAEDVPTVATGEHKGFAFKFNYDLLLAYEGNSYEVAMDDWMYQMDEYRVMNKTSLSKFGVVMADITIFFDKEKPLKTCTIYKQN
jgi:hypothetical protein